MKAKMVRLRNVRFASMFSRMALSPGAVIYSVANASVSFAPSVVTPAASRFLPQLAGILNSPPTNNAQNMNEDERPCKLHLFSAGMYRGSTLIASPGPSCRQPISSSKLFTLEAFNSPKQSTSSKKGKRRASGRPFEFATDSMDLDESDSDDGFIVPDDDDDKPRRGKKYAKRNVVLSDDDEYDDVIIPAVKPEAKPKASVGEMNEDEISTKMQVRAYLPCVISSTHPDVSEDDERVNHSKEVTPRPEGTTHPLHVFSLADAHSIRPLSSPNGQVILRWFHDI